ncbi:MAG TPA: alpha/beta hydrolase domain-containing protein, partial [Steroidobacteraceae bacterium]|nr:alpha/beta hydrolase domain-containing protein [Steroidobacteraceae bacterium]
MHNRYLAVTTTVMSIAFAAAQPSEARVVKFVVEQRSTFVGGAAWGNVGAYEMLRGTAYLEVDPRDPRDAVIVDLENAPRNAHGMVDFSTQFLILKPVDPGRGNHKIFYAVNNRGNSLEGLLTATTAAQVSGTDAGYAMTEGYTIVDAGWEGDVIPTSTKLVATLPVAREANGGPIIGPMRYEYSDRVSGSYTTNLEGTAGFLSYEAADTNTAHATFTVSDSEYGPKTLIPPNRWAFGTCPTGQASLVPDTVDLCYFDGFDNAKIYELIYQAKNPIVMGLGFATTRDVASFLRYETRDDVGNANPVGTAITRAYAAGGSQTGGYLRDYIYLGFNEDESQRQVFDGIIPWIAGTDRVFINVRFADPNTYSEQDRQHNYLQSSYPPFTYAVTTDPLSGIHDGIMKRPRTDPLVMQVDSESEFWQL